RRPPTDHRAGSGAGSLDFSDDEDLMDSGSGSGSDKIIKSTTATTTTTRLAKTTDHPLTDCEAMRQSSRSLLGKYVPRCLPNGDYDSLQCHGYPGTSECWCSDLLGREIPGTLMEAPNYPSCDDGNNLPPCVHQLVKYSRSKLLGSFQPACAVDGQFDRVQCHGSMCFCVHESTGQRITGSEVHKPEQPKCGAGVDENVDKKEESEKEGRRPQDDNKTGTGGGDVRLKPGHGGLQEEEVEKASEIVTQPGILAGIIGGSVVLFLCIVLLVMFIVYRMRKKDEGSYPLDEPRKTPNYNYVRAPDKEFYA
ncbi:unnamed protein product, partial [Candidula unifasciata]